MISIRSGRVNLKALDKPDGRPSFSYDRSLIEGTGSWVPPIKVPETMSGRPAQIRLNGVWWLPSGTEARKPFRPWPASAYIRRGYTVVQKANQVIFSVDFYKGLWENLDKARLMRNKRNS